MQESKTVQINTIVSGSKLNRSAAKDGIDTGVADGSGELTVTAAKATGSRKGTTFHDVEITALSPASGKKGYGSWSEEGLILEARSLLERDYCH